MQLRFRSDLAIAIHILASSVWVIFCPSARLQWPVLSALVLSTIALLSKKTTLPWRALISLLTLGFTAGFLILCWSINDNSFSLFHCFGLLFAACFYLLIPYIVIRTRGTYASQYLIQTVFSHLIYLALGAAAFELVFYSHFNTSPFGTQFYSSEIHIAGNSSRIRLWFPEPGFASFFVNCCLWSLMSIRQMAKINKIPWGAFVACAVFQLLCFSAVGLSAFIFSVLVFSVINFYFVENKNWFILPKIIFFLSLSAITAFYLDLINQSKIETFLLKSAFEDASGIGRSERYSMAISEFMNSPIIGLGLGHHSLSDDKTGVFSLLLTIASESGLFGITATVFILLILFFHLKPSNPRANSIFLASGITLAVHWSFITAIDTPWPWMLLAITAAMISKESKHFASPPNHQPRIHPI